VQLHGPLSDDLLRYLREQGVGVIKALSITSDEFYDFDEGRVDVVMVDGAAPGSGESHSWEELADRPFAVPVLAAGGLNDANVAAVITTSPVWGVDAASGVESSPGIKDRDKIERFVTNALAAFQARVTS
jgi:phosphoribosylanthranilate isomerase